MARKPRIHYNGAFYHVIARGNNKEYVFRNDIDKEEYLERLRDYLIQYKAKLYAYVLLDNHCHLLIQVSDIPLSKIMQLVQQTYTTYYNRTYHHTGHVFEQRYKSILCDKDEYLLSLVRYIHLNPVRAGISDVAYKYSSHNEYIDKRKLCEIDEVLVLFSEDRSKAINSYLEYMDMKDKEIEDKKNSDFLPSMEVVVAEIKNMSYDKISLEELIEKFQQSYEISIEDIKGKYLKGKLTEYRNSFIKEVLMNKVMYQSELANYLNISNYLVSKVWNS